MHVHTYVHTYISAMQSGQVIWVIWVTFCAGQFGFHPHMFTCLTWIKITWLYTYISISCTYIENYNEKIDTV